MHSFLRAIGFSKIKKNLDMDTIINEIIENPDNKMIAEDNQNNVFVELTKDYGECIGIAVRGEYREEDIFHADYYYPYFIGAGISTEEKIDIEKHAEKESYAGVCDEIKIGVTLIFYLQNIIDYLNWKRTSNNKKQNVNTTLSALSISGTIVLPIQKDETRLKDNEKLTSNRNHLIAAARDGDEDAIESLTLEDIDTYSMLSRRIIKEDVLSIVDTYFMPYGIESDQYSILGEIIDYSTIENRATNEKIYILTIDSNDLVFDVCINKEDLLGEPVVGRRFKGNIWMQGNVNYLN
ncbi:DUF3881 family protein [Lachnospiraceae bacterium ZAX-1]